LSDGHDPDILRPERPENEMPETERSEPDTQPEKRPSPVLRYGVATDVGRVRTNNEDSLLVLDGLWAVADGMGGHRAGEVASQLAVRGLELTMASVEQTPTVEQLIEGVRRANIAIIEDSLTNPDHRGMGTTITALAPVDLKGEETLAVINVGDSRTYRLHDGELEQLTEDHSMVQEMVRDGRLTPEEAATHPQRNVVTRALGVEPDLDVDWLTVTPYAGDRFVLASDGLFDEIPDRLIAGVLRRQPDPYAAADELVRLANEAGGHDNVTVIVVDVVDDGGRAETASGALASDKTQAVPIVGTAFARTGVAVKPSDTDTSTEEDVDAARGAPATTDEATSGAGDAASAAAADDRRGRRLTWRVVAFAAVVVLILAVAAGAVLWQARNTYFVTFDDGEVTIFRGQPGGLLWFEPTVEERTGITEREVPPFRRTAIENGVERSSLAEAERYVATLQELIDERATTTTTSTTTTATTTTVPPTTVPVAPPPTVTP
jgi:protein phosphatase